MTTDKKQNKALSKILGLSIAVFGEPFTRFQRWLFYLFIAGTILQLPYGYLVEKKDFITLWEQTQRAAFWWLIIAASTMLLWLICKQFFDLDLRIYYFFWIPYIVPLLGKRIYTADELELLKLVRESYRYEKKGKRPCPVFVNRAHLDRRSFWPHWDFAIIVINNPDKFEVDVAISKSNHRDARWVMVANLADESYGIYNNYGKQFLQDKFCNENTKEQMLKLSKKYFDILQPNVPPGRSIKWGDGNTVLPLRWASGGFLTIIRYQDRDWAMFFFRDIQPIGLNLANGASESKAEYKNLNHLIGREFSEETVLLTSRPYPGATVLQKRFTTPNVTLNDDNSVIEYINPAFSEKHNQLRKAHDNITIRVPKYSEEEGRAIKSIDTPFRVRVYYHTPDLKTIENSYFKNVIFSINPFEFGVEVLWLCKFEMEADECILDGEYDYGRGYLVRQPVIMLEMDFLKEVFSGTGSLGKPIPGTDSKLLPEIPQGKFIIFTEDIELRKQRLEAIIEQLKKPLTSQNFDNLKFEKDLDESWLHDYLQPFEQSRQGNLCFEPFRRLCPVAWKSLELVFSHKINYSKAD